MNIDPATIVVLVLTATAGVLLVWIELHSRRNSQLQQAETPPPIDNAAEAAPPPVHAPEGAIRRRRRRRL
ncbi:MAG TPA: hypothetical protein VFU76_06945 [Terriglobales bacterium]|nr:hypothetical protein [Terriglobales bacterium]